MNEVFESKRQFVVECESKLVELVNVLSYQRKDDASTQLAPFKRLAHENPQSETVNDDTKTGVTVLKMEDMWVKARLIWTSVRIASWAQMCTEIPKITRTQLYTDSQPVPMQIGVHPKGKGKGSKDARNKSSEKVQEDDQRRCFNCRKTGHEKSQCKTRRKDLADAEGKPATANSHSHNTAEKHRGVSWLPCSATEHTDGAAPSISATDFETTAMQLEGGEETRRQKPQDITT